MNNKNEQEIISLLQDNLSSVRKIAGWTTEELGDMIGVTKQTISNLENKKTVMTRTQYIALGAVLKYEIPSNKNSEVLSYVVDMLLDNNENYSDDEREKIKKNIEMLAIASMGGMKGKNLKDFGEKLGIVISIVGAGAAMAGAAGTALADATIASGSAVIPMMVATSTTWLGAILGSKAMKKTKDKKKDK